MKPNKGFTHPVILLILLLLIGIGFIFLKNITSSPERIIASKAIKTETRDNLKIDRNVSLAEVKVAKDQKVFSKKVELAITNTSGKPLTNVRFVEKIPKEFAQSSDELVFDPQPTAILNKDVEVLYEFGEIKPQGGMKIMYQIWQKATGQDQQPKIEDLAEAFVKTIAEGVPKVDQIPQESKDYTSIASLVKKAVIEKKVDEVVDKEYLVHGVIIQPYNIPAWQQFLGGLIIKTAQIALDSFMPEGAVSKPMLEAMGKFKDASIENTYNFVTKDLRLILGDLPIEAGETIDGGLVPPLFTLYNWPLGETPELQAGHVFVGKVKLTKLANGTIYFHILPGFKYDNPSGYVSLYELGLKLVQYKGKEVTTIGRVVEIQEKEGAKWIKIILDGYRDPNQNKKIYGHSVWALLPADFSPNPQKNLVLTLSGVIKEANFVLSIEDKDDNRLYLTVGATAGEQATTSLPKAKIVDDKKVFLGDKLLLDIKDYEPGCSGFYKIDYASTNDYFYVLLGCFENDDRLFLFKADGSDKKEITGKWDVANNGIVDWDPDGKSFVYHRINSCCVEPERFGEKGPPVGMVRYIIATGDKTVIGPYKPPATSTPTVAPLKTEGGKVMTVAEYFKMPPIQGKNDLGACNETAPPIIMQLEITKYVAFELDRWYHYEGKDSTGTVDTYLVHFDNNRQDWVAPSQKFQIGKTYLFKGCKLYVGTGGPSVPGREETAFGVDETQKDSIVEK